MIKFPGYLIHDPLDGGTDNRVVPFLVGWQLQTVQRFWRMIDWHTERRGVDAWLGLGWMLFLGSGDCEDHVLAAIDILETLGWPKHDLWLLQVVNAKGVDHAVLLVRDSNGELVVMDPEFKDRADCIKSLEGALASGIKPYAIYDRYTVRAVTPDQPEI